MPWRFLPPRLRFFLRRPVMPVPVVPLMPVVPVVPAPVARRRVRRFLRRRF